MERHHCLVCPCSVPGSRRSGRRLLPSAFSIEVPISAFGGQLRVDALSALMIIFIGVVGSISAAYGVAYIRTELGNEATTPRRATLFGVLMQLTIAAMLVVVIADNLGVLWVAAETTTIATVLLVGHRRDRASVEASWKYLVLGSVGVATALLGTVLVYFVSRHSGIDASSALRWSSLVDRAHDLDPGALRVAIGFVVVGYGTKAGLAPVHSWIPDAYSQAPAPGGSTDGRRAVGDVDVRPAAVEGRRRHHRSGPASYARC